MSITDWKEIFEQEEDVPNWFRSFDQDPEKALADALWGRYYFGNLNLAEPAILIIEWLTLIGEKFNFASRLDEALAQVVRKYWGTLSDPHKNLHRGQDRRIAIFWIRVCNLVNWEKPPGSILPKTVAALLEFEPNSKEYFHKFFPGSPSHDPLPLYQKAIAP